MGDDHTRDTPDAHTGHEHIGHDHEHDGDYHDKAAAVRSPHRLGLRHVRHVRFRERPRGSILKKRTGLAATGGAAFVTVHSVLAIPAFVIVHGVLTVLVGVAIWRWAGGIVAGLLVVGVVLYLGVRRRPHEIG